MSEKSIRKILRRFWSMTAFPFSVLCYLLIKDMEIVKPPGMYVLGSPKWLKKTVKLFCRLATRHKRLSDTEWGYGGGGYADRYCFWCDQKIKVPRESIRFKFKDSSFLMDEVGQEK